MASEQVKGTLEGYALWALHRFMKCLGKKEGTAVTAIFDRWLEADAEHLERLGITLQQYWLELEAAGEEPPPSQTKKQQPRKPPGPN